MKKTIILILTLSLILGVFSSCGHKTVDPIDDQTSSSPSEDTSAESTENVIDDSTESNEVNQSENTETDDRLTEITEETSFVFVPENYGYTIEKIGDDYYIKFLAVPEDRGEIMGVHFSSLQQFYRVLHLQELMSDANLYDIYHSFEKDDIGYKIIDIDNIHYPVLPDGIAFENPIMPVSWDQYSYSFTVNYDGASRPAGMSDGVIKIITRNEDYIVVYNSERYSNATEVLEGNKEVRVTAPSYFEVDENMKGYEYYALIKIGDIYAEIQLTTKNLLEDNSIFLDFDFEKYP